jgi:hypothetical protein
MFQTNVPLVAGLNRIRVTDKKGWELFGGSNELRFVAALPAADIWTELSWDGEGDIDLHLLQPDGEECFYQHKTTEKGAVLDADNTLRDGPEHITMTQAIPGEYTISVVYFRALQPRAVPWQVTLRLRNGSLKEFHGLLHTVDEKQTVTTFRFP